MAVTRQRRICHDHDTPRDPALGTVAYRPWRLPASEAAASRQRRLRFGDFLRAVRPDILWNVSSIVLGGLCGIGLNVVIGLFYDATVLGIFNQAFAVYIVLSQVASGGCHSSALKHVAETGSPSARIGHIVLPALLATATFSLATASVFWFTRHWMGTILDSSGVAVAIAWAAPGLFFFGLSKVLMASLNGLGRLRWYAVFQSARPVLMLATVFVVATRAAPGETLTVAFSVAETAVFLGLLAVLASNLRPGLPMSIRPWLIRHVSFGMRGLPGGLLAELNTRVDILVLGFFATDRATGIYSFAAILAEGVMQLPVAVRAAYTPGLTKLLAADDPLQLQAFVRNGKRVAIALMILTATLAIPLYPVFVHLATADAEIEQTWLLFTILVLGVVLASRYIPFGQALLLAGRPGLQSAMALLVVGGNFAINLALIPLLGITGAAIANAATQVFSAMLLRLFSQRAIGLVL